MTNDSRPLYTGMANHPERRVFEPKRKLLHGSTRQGNIDPLVYYENCGDIRAAIQREKHIKYRKARNDRDWTAGLEWQAKCADPSRSLPGVHRAG